MTKAKISNLVKASKADAGNAERAVEHFAKVFFECVETRRMIRTKFFKVDFFGADVVGKDQYGQHYYIQVTSGQDSAVTARKRKMEKHVWHDSDKVYVIQMLKFKVGRKVEYNFRIWQYWYNSSNSREWLDISQVYGIEAFPVQREWFRALK